MKTAEERIVKVVTDQIDNNTKLWMLNQKLQKEIDELRAGRCSVCGINETFSEKLLVECDDCNEFYCGDHIAATPSDTAPWDGTDLCVSCAEIREDR